MVVIENFHEMRISLSNWQLLEQNDVPAHIVPMHFYISLALRMGYAHPLPGTIMSSYIKLTEASKVYVTGCSCYQENGVCGMAWPHFYEGHVCYADSHFMKDLIEGDARFSCDEVMQRELGKSKI